MGVIERCPWGKSLTGPYVYQASSKFKQLFEYWLLIGQKSLCIPFILFCPIGCLQACNPFVCFNTKYRHKSSSLAKLPVRQDFAREGKISASAFHGRKSSKVDGNSRSDRELKFRMTGCPLSPKNLLCILYTVLCLGPLGLQRFVQVISLFYYLSKGDKIKGSKLMVIQCVKKAKINQ